ncbi:MAG: Crp/Fnr family transcriptional regulator [Bacteroidia bacterium]|nr:Crp/Fnr family transcriptional regulator [Bacteroidia bacterium]
MSVFSVLPPEKLEELMAVKSTMVFYYGELIFKEGQFPSGIYILNKGKVKISKYGYEGREQIVRFAREGDVLGYRTLFNNDKYTCSASAIEESHVCYISSSVLFRLIRDFPELSFRFLSLLATDLKNAEEKAMRMAQKTVRERVAESILILKEIYGFEEDGATLNINLKRDEIAGIAGTVRETATRFLSELNESHIISLSGKKIRILDIKKLIRSANVFE